MNQRELALLSLGLRLGTHDVGDVVTWADLQIAALAAPSTELIDLSMSARSHAMDLVAKLENLAGEVSVFEVLPDVLGHAHRMLSEDPSFGPTLARNLYSLYVSCDYEVPDSFGEIAVFDDAYGLARDDTYGTETDVYERLLAFAGRFRGLE